MLFPMKRKSFYMTIVTSLMFAGINVCVFETKPCLRRLITITFVVSSGLVNYLGR